MTLTQCQLSRRRVPIIAAILAIGFSTTLFAASSAGDPQPATDKPAFVESVVERGPVRITATARPAVARLSDDIELTVTIAAEKGVELQKPPFGATIGDFNIRDVRDSLPRVEADRDVTEQVFTLEPTQTGKLIIDPIAIAFRDTRTGDGKEQVVASNALAIEVGTMLKTQAPTLGELKPAVGPLELAAARWPYIIGIVAVAALAAGLWSYLAKRRVFSSAQVMTPRQLALKELEMLVAEGWMDRDVKWFYVGLTGIVRRYLERTTSVHAPEQTTEEFCREIGKQPSFTDTERDRLRDFLESSDLVKFAGFKPTRDVVEESLTRARIFVETPRGVELKEGAATP